MVVDINLTPTASHIDIARAQNATGTTFNEVGKSLPARTWGTPSECVAGAILVHGLGAHSGWFEALGRRLRIRRIYSIAYDQVGFGRRRGEVFTSYNQWLEDMQTAYTYARSIVGDKPLYIMGNSMGAVVALRAVSSGEVAPTGLVMFSPGFDGHPETFSLPYRMRALLQAYLHPDKEIDLPYSPDLVSRDKSVRKWIANDPERRFNVPARMLLELLKLTNDIGPRSRKVTCPILMLSAGVDKIVNPKVSERLFEQLTCPKEKKLYSEAWHDLMFDPVIDEMCDELASWISETSKKGKISAANRK